MDAGSPVPRSVTEVVDTLRALPARFHIETEVPSGSVSLASLADVEVTRRLVEHVAESRGLDSVPWPRASHAGQVAASLTVQGIAMRLGGAVLAGVVLDRSLLVARPEDIFVGVQGPMFSVSITRADVVTSSEPRALLADWEAHWLDGHFRSIVDAVRGVQRVGEVLLWGNVASAVAATFVFFDWWDPDCGARHLAEQTLGLGHPRLGDSASLTDVEVAGRIGLRSERSACCLLKLVPGAHLCPTCPKTHEDERIAATSQHVQHLFAVRAGATGPPPWVTRT